jgi:hypothetical protein
MTHYMYVSKYNSIANINVFCDTLQFNLLKMDYYV